MRAGQRVRMAMEIDGDDFTGKLGGLRQKDLFAE
jgi:hypothetical protein